MMGPPIHRLMQAAFVAFIASLWPSMAHAGEAVGRSIGEEASIFVVLGVIASAYLLSYLLLQWLSQRYGFVTGVPYVVLGIIAVPATGLLEPPLMEGLEPLIAVAVGAVALAAGLEVNARKLADQGATTIKLSLMVAAVTVGVVVLGPWIAIRQWQPPMESVVWWPALLVLGALALVSDGRPLEALAKHLKLDNHAIEQAREVSWLSTMLAVVVFGIALSIHNPGHEWFGNWMDLGPWFFLHLMVGGVLGAIGGTMMQARPDDDRVLTILLGVVLTTSAVGYVTSLSIVFVNFVAGVVLINMSSESLRLRQMLDSANAPFYVLLLFVAGTMWTVGLSPWVYVAVAGYLMLRVVGRWLGVALFRPRLSGYRPEPGMYRALLAPGALSAAMIIDFSFGFGTSPEIKLVISGLVLILIAEEVISYFLLRGWLIDIADMGATRGTSSPWGDWRGGQ